MMTNASSPRWTRLTAGALALSAVLAVTVVAPVFAHDTGTGGSGAGIAAQAQAQAQNENHDRDHHGHGAAKVRFYSNPSYSCPTGAQPAQGAKTYGFAILNTTAPGKVNVTVVLRGAQPNATYDLWINQDPGACPLSTPTKVGALHTNGRGNGAAQLRVALVAGAKHFWVSAVSGTDVLRTPAADLVWKHAA